MVAKAPKAPDPVATAQAQSAMNRDTAITQYGLNATNQKTPYGDLTYNQIGKWEDGTPRYEATQTLSPELAAISQNLLGSANQLSGNLNGTVGQAFDASTLPARGGSITGGQGLQSDVGMNANLSSGRVSLTDVPVNASWSGPQARYNIDNAGPIQKSIGANDWSADRSRVEDAIFSRLNPSLERDRASLDAKLRAQGITQGSEAYRNATDELNRSATDARLQTVLAGGQEQSRLAGLELQQGNFRNAAQAQQYGQNANDAAFFNSAQAQNFGQSMTMDQFARDGIGINNQNRLSQTGFNNDAAMQDASFNNNAALQQASFRNQAQNQGFNQQLAAEQYNSGNRQQALQEAAYLRSLPLNEINALLGGTQIANPQFTNTPTPGVAGVDYAGLVQQNYQAQVQAANQKNANLFGGLAAIGKGIGAFMSDRRLKRDIQPIRATLSGLQLYSYRYLGSDKLSFGVMADEVAAAKPEAVTEISGFNAVHYDMLEAA